MYLLWACATLKCYQIVPHWIFKLCKVLNNFKYITISKDTDEDQPPDEKERTFEKDAREDVLMVSL